MLTAVREPHGPRGVPGERYVLHEIFDVPIWGSVPARRAIFLRLNLKRDDTITRDGRSTAYRKVV